MDNNVLSKVLMRLPNLITLFFSLTLVTGFRLLNDRFHWNTAPDFDITDWNDVLVLASFLTTLVFIVTAWLGFSVLIERVPYHGSFGRFLFDTARFSAIFPLLMWSFLAEKPEHFHVYTFGLACWHLAMTIWYAYPYLTQRGTSPTGHVSDLRSHGMISLSYFILGFLSYTLVAKTWPTDPKPGLHIGMVLLTLSVIIVWSVNRLLNLQGRLVNEVKAKELTS